MRAIKSTRVASGAQRSGAATHLLHYFRRERDDCRLRAFNLFFSLFPSPGPFGADKIVARRLSRRHRAGGCGSQVLHGPGGRTRKRLKSIGSAVLFCGPTRDACVGARMHACRDIRQNYRTSEPKLRNERKAWVSTARPVLSRFCGSGANKIGRGYAAPVTELDQLRDPQCLGGAAPRNFSAWRTRPAAIGLDLGRVGREGGNGGFLRVSGGRSGLVGMAMSEWCTQAVGFVPLSKGSHKLSRLSAAPDLDVPSGATEGAGSIVQAEGGGPPSAARLSSCMLAHAIFRISICPASLGIDARRVDWVGCSRNSAEMGSGDCIPCASAGAESRAALNLGCGTRVGDSGGPVGLPDGKPWTLWGGLDHVNA